MGKDRNYLVLNQVNMEASGRMVCISPSHACKAIDMEMGELTCCCDHAPKHLAGYFLRIACLYTISHIQNAITNFYIWQKIILHHIFAVKKCNESHIFLGFDMIWFFWSNEGTCVIFCVNIYDLKHINKWQCDINVYNEVFEGPVL